MGLEAATDPQIAALLTLVKGGVNAELKELLEVDAIDGAYNRPLPLSILPKQRLPALAIWRQREARINRTTSHLEKDATIRVDYYGPTTPLSKLGDIWPLLSVVNDKIFEVICAGKHKAVAGGAELLCDAGVVEIRDENIATQFAFAEGGRETAYPAFQATMRMRHREPPDLSKLADFVSVGITYDVEARRTFQQLIHPNLSTDDPDPEL